MEVLGFCIIAIIILLVFFITGAYHEYKARKYLKQKLIEDYGKKNKREYRTDYFLHVAGYLKHHSKNFQIDEITWNDLNLDEIFKEMNYSKSSAGEEYLYYLLHTPKTADTDFQKDEKIIEYFRSHELERQALSLALLDMGTTGKYSIYDYLKNLDTLGQRSSIKDILIDLLFIPAIILLNYQVAYGLICIFILAIYNILTYFKEKGKIDPYITSFSYIFRILQGVDTVCQSRSPFLEEEKQQLKALKNQFGKFRRFSKILMNSNRMSGDPFEVIIDYIRMCFHLDLIKFNSMLKEVRKHESEIDEMITLIGKIDTWLTIGEYRTYLKDFCIPIFQKNVFEIKDLYHPLLKDPVKNSVSIKRSILLTGSNASGKSTFLKTVALNSIFAQTIHTVTASSYTADYFKVYTSLTLKDDIIHGDSYYMAEIKSIKRILDATNDGTVPVLCFVDEVLRGTNTVERIAASSVILKVLSNQNGYCIAATHDIELTTILEKIYDNYHFEETICENDIAFPYKLEGGRATTRNAIRLLSIMGYHQDIVKQAEKMAENFMESGIWSSKF